MAKTWKDNFKAIYNSPYFKVFTAFFKVGLGFLALYILYSKKDDFFVYTENGSLSYFLLGLLMSHIGFGLLGIRLHAALKIFGLNLPNLLAYKYNLQAMFYLVFTPSFLGMDSMKVLKLVNYFEQQNNAISKKKLGLAVIGDRFLGLFILLVMSGFFFLFAINKISIPLPFNIYYAAAALYAIGIISIPLAFKFLKNRKGNLGEAVNSLIDNKAQSLYTLGVGIIGQLFYFFGIWIIATSIGIDISFLHLVFIMSTALIMNLIPFSVGGIGGAEAGSTLLYMAMGYSSETALTLVAISYCLKLLNSLIGGGWEIFDELKQLTKLKTTNS